METGIDFGGPVYLTRERRYIPQGYVPGVPEVPCRHFVGGVWQYRGFPRPRLYIVVTQAHPLFDH